MIEHLAAISFMLVIVGFSTSAIWLNYRFHALEAGRAANDVRDGADERSVVEAGWVASGA